MKKSIIISILILITGIVNAQTSVKPKIDSIPKVDTSYAIIVSKEEWQAIANLFKLQDEKPSVINAEINELIKKTQMILPPKEKPKK